MGLQLFSDRTWEEDSFNEINTSSVAMNANDKNKDEHCIGFVINKDLLEMVIKSSLKRSQLKPTIKKGRNHETSSFRNN